MCVCVCVCVYLCVRKHGRNTHRRTSVPYGLTPTITIYPIITSASAVLSVQSPLTARLGPDLILLRAETSLTYWSPRDPYRVRTIDFLDWRLHVRSGELFVFRRDAEFLLWLWGAATAVRARFWINTWCAVHACNGAAFLETSERGRQPVYLLPLLSEPTVNGLPLPALPVQSAPLLRPRLLVNTVPASVAIRAVLTLPGGSEVHPPLMTCGDHKLPDSGVWRVTAREPPPSGAPWPFVFIPGLNSV